MITAKLSARDFLQGSRKFFLTQTGRTLFSVNLEVTRRCNLRCDFCDYWRETGREERLADYGPIIRLSTNRTPEQADIARYWAAETPSTRWITFLDEEIRSRRWPGVRAARAYAYLSVAMYDAFVACWDVKYTYWLLRPISADSNLVTVFSTPPFPSYPSGHSTISAAAADVMAELFPDRAAHYRALADEASVSRVYGGVHYRFDVLIGEELGRSVGAAVVERMRGDGSQE